MYPIMNLLMIVSMIDLITWDNLQERNATNVH